MLVSHAVVAGAGCSELAAAVLLQAELASVSAAPDAPADGTVIESRLDKGLGPVFVTIIRDGNRNLWLFDRFEIHDLGQVH
jgi:translation initiation factor IF-2